MSLVMPGDRLQERGIYLDGRSGDHWAETSTGLVVPSYAVDPEPAPLPVAVDLFCGAGGMSCGFHAAGWDVAAACENEFDAALTYLVNLGGPDTVVIPLNDITPPRRKGKPKPPVWREGDAIVCGEAFPDAGTGWISSERDHEPGTCATHIDDPEGRLAFCESYHAPPPHRNACRVFYLGDIRNLTGKDVLNALGRDDVDCVVGGPPCQGFSKANPATPEQKRRDPRNLLVFEFARLVLETNAKTMVMENVPQITTMLTAEGVPVIDALCRVLEDGGFSGYDALRSSLLANAGAGGAMRRKPGSGSGDDGDDDQEPEPDAQGSLFAGASA